MNIAAYRRRATRQRGITLILTLVALAVATLWLSRRMMNSSVVRLSAMSVAYSSEGQEIATGIARQWLARSQDKSVLFDDLLQPAEWSLGDWQVTITPSSTANKIAVNVTPFKDWKPLFDRVSPNLPLVDDPDQALLVSGSTALESILSSRVASAKPLYLPVVSGTAPADLLTVWGNGKMDINHASRDVMMSRLQGWTDAQVDGIIRLRTQKPITDFATLADDLSLSDHQQQVLADVGTTTPSFVELLIRTRRGGFTALYHAVIQTGKDGQVEEVRVIQ